MNFIIVTDRFDVGKTRGEVEFGRGSRAYYCGEENGAPKLIWGISDAVRFESREAADMRALILCVIIPPLIDHINIVTETEAWDQWNEELAEFKKKLESQGVPRDNGGCF